MSPRYKGTFTEQQAAKHERFDRRLAAVARIERVVGELQRVLDTSETFTADELEDWVRHAEGTHHYQQDWIELLGLAARCGRTAVAPVPTYLGMSINNVLLTAGDGPRMQTYVYQAQVALGDVQPPALPQHMQDDPEALGRPMRPVAKSGTTYASGAGHPQPPRKSPWRTLICGDCGAEVEGFRMRCPSCGAEIRVMEDTQSPTKEPA